MYQGWRVAMVGLLAGVALAWSPAGAAAGTITVDTDVDDITPNSNCTLREAIQAANDNLAVDDCPDPGDPGSADTIILGNDTYPIGIPPEVGSPDDNGDGDFDIDTDAGSGNLTIQGNGRLVTEIDALDVDRVLHLLGGGTVTVSGVSVRNGNRTGTMIADRGGGIFAQSAALNLNSSEVVGSDTNAEGGGVAILFNGSMTFANSRINMNQAHGGTGGGGIHWQPGTSTPTLTLSDTPVTNNTASTMAAATDMFGGGITSFGKLTVSTGLLSGNQVIATGTAHGGGIYHNGLNGAATFNVARIMGNSATDTSPGGSAEGGGISFLNQEAGNGIAVSLTATTLSGNFLDSPVGSLQQGGGVFGLNPSRMRIANSTVSGNMAPDAGGDGGGIHDNGVQMDIAHTTFAENFAADLGSAVNLALTGTDTVRNSIFAEGANACDSAFFTTVGGNVDAGSSCWAVNAMNDVQNQPAQLGPLAANGSPQGFTHALALTSPARDRIPVADCDDDFGFPIMQDQRGQPRPIPAGGLCDSGSYELIVCNGAPFNPSVTFTVCPPPPATTTPPAITPTPQTPVAKKKKKCKKKKKKRRSATAAKKCKKKKKKRR